MSARDDLKEGDKVMVRMSYISGPAWIKGVIKQVGATRTWYVVDIFKMGKQYCDQDELVPMKIWESPVFQMLMEEDEA